MTVTIRTRTVGQSFAVVADVIDRQGRTLHTTQPRPHGMPQAARADAQSWADANRHYVATE